MFYTSKWFNFPLFIRILDSTLTSEGNKIKNNQTIYARRVRVGTKTSQYVRTLTYLPINWVDGLKLTSQHFFANQYCRAGALNREAGRSLTSYNYGLGEVLKGIDDNLEIEISGDTMSTLYIRLKSCNAVTKGSLPIVYYDGLYGDEKLCATISESGLQAEDSEYMVLASIDPYYLIPVGEPDPEEVPSHHPYVLPNIKLHIVPKNQVNKPFYSQNFLLVAEVCR